LLAIQWNGTVVNGYVISRFIKIAELTILDLRCLCSYNNSFHL